MRTPGRSAANDSNRKNRVWWMAVAVAGALILHSALVHAQSWNPCPYPNRTDCENRQGSVADSDWRILYPVNALHAFDGFASPTSVNYRDDHINLYIRSPDGTYDLDVYRMGWYGGRGGRRVYQSTQSFRRANTASLHDGRLNPFGSLRELATKPAETVVAKPRGWAGERLLSRQAQLPHEG